MHKKITSFANVFNAGWCVTFIKFIGQDHVIIKSCFKFELSRAEKLYNIVSMCFCFIVKSIYLLIFRIVLRDKSKFFSVFFFSHFFSRLCLQFFFSLTRATACLALPWLIVQEARIACSVAPRKRRHFSARAYSPCTLEHQAHFATNTNSPCQNLSISFARLCEKAWRVWFWTWMWSRFEAILKTYNTSFVGLHLLLLNKFII